MEAATNKAEVEAFKARKAETESQGKRLNPDDMVRPLIPFEACLSKFCENEIVQDFYSSAAKAKTVGESSCWQPFQIFLNHIAYFEPFRVNF